MKKVWVFFYGTFMCARVLKQYGINCDITYPAKVSGYALSIRPRVNLQKDVDSNCYGGVAHVDNSELADLYREVHKTFGHIYYPYPILAEMKDGSFRQALCFISEQFDAGSPDAKYIDEMIQCAKEMEAPEGYLVHIDSFRKSDQ